MLKAASKASRTKTLLNQHAQRSVTTHHVYTQQNLQFQKRRDILDTFAYVKHHVGHLKLNREHRYNTQTPNYIKNIARSLQTLNYDDVVKVICMTGAKGEHFSNGTDFRTILHHKKDGQPQKIQEYLDALYSLQIQTSKINKPLIGVAPGHSFNSGATLFQATGYPIVALDAKIAFNEASFGFVPHGGSSFYLSRLPGEIGTFLSLTGLPITAIDAKEFGIAENVIHYPKAYEEDLGAVLFSVEFPLPNSYFKTNWGRQNPLRERILRDKRMKADELADDIHEVTRKKHENLIMTEFIEPKDNKPSTNAKADFLHRQMLKKYHERYEQRPGYLDEVDGENIAHNHYKYLLDYIKSHSGHEFARDATKSYIKQVETINRCFYSNTVEEIMENLKREGSPFAQFCLQKMQANSMLSMKLGLKMLRQARNLDFKGCLTNELNVAMNKIQDKEFDLGVSEILLKPQRSPLPYNPGFQTQISDDQVLSYFQKNKFAEDIDLDVVEKAMLPTRFYYQNFSDQVRLWINEDTTPQPEVRKFFDVELKEALRNVGIDIRDRALTIESARDALYQKELMQRRQQVFNDRLQVLLRDGKLRQKYQAQVAEQLQNLDQNTPEFYKRVNTKIQEVFENAYLEKLQKVYDKSTEVQNLEKRRMFIRFKKFLFQSRILNFFDEEMERTFKILQNMPYKLPHLTEKWDGDKTWREMDHPELQSSFLYYFSKIVGRTNIAPIELGKKYLTDPSMHNKMNLFTFDKEELLKLRRDILENPKKYELLLRSDNGTFTLKEQDLRSDYKRRKREEYDYWYRVLNEGRLPTDSLPFYKQLIAYQDFMQTVELKAIGTLRTTVQRLLNDFEHEDEVNEIKNFSQKDKESKHEALKRLIAVVNESEQVLKPSSSKKKSKNEKVVQLTQTSRPLNDIKKSINRLLEQDDHVKRLIPAVDESVADNVLVKNLRQQILDKLYSILEFVLLNNANNQLPENLLKERLAQLANPSNYQQKNVTSLRIIDSFLNEKSNDELVKEAIRIAKPYFFTELITLIENESQKVFDGFHAPHTGNNALFFYFMNLKFPEIHKSAIFKKVQTYNDLREKQKAFESLFPDLSNNYFLKNFTLLMGQDLKIDSKAPLADQEAQLQAQVKKQYEQLRKLKEDQQKLEKEYLKQSDKEKEERHKRPFDHDEPNNEVDKEPNFDIYKYNSAELDQFLEYSHEAENLTDFIVENETDLRRTMTACDWLDIYSSIINDYNCDFQGLLRISFEEGRYIGRDFLKELQSQFGGNQKIDWQSLGTYAKYLSDLHLAGVDVFDTPEASKNLELVQDYFVKQMDIVDAQAYLNNETLYQKLKRTQSLIQHHSLRNYDMKQELRDFTKFQRRVEASKKVRDSISNLSDQAPLSVRERVEALLNSQSEYLNLEKLESALASQKYEDIYPNKLIDKQRIAQEINSGRLLQQWNDNYLNTPLDVVSIAQTKEIIKNQESKQGFNDNKLKQQILFVLNFADDSLKSVPNSRRQEITLGEYLKRHSFLNTSSLEDYANDILKKKLNELIGSATDLEGVDMIDWEFGNFRTQPLTHQRHDQLIQEALERGQGIDSQAQLDKYIEDQSSRKNDDFIELEKSQVQFVNEETGRLEQQDEGEYLLHNIFRKAKQLVELKPDLQSIKNQYENKILEIYSAADFDQKELEYVIQRYTEIRLKDCLLNPEFAKELKSNNGQYYMKILKEQIADELSLTRPAEVGDFTFAKWHNSEIPTLDPEAKYNLTGLSNGDALGYDNLLERAKNPDQNRDLAHESIFDKLLADYFLQKRGQYKANNDLLEQLNKQFDRQGVQTDASTEYSDIFDKDLFSQFPFRDDGAKPNLAFNLLKQRALKGERQADILPQDFTEMMELDIITQQALTNKKAGLAQKLREDIPEEYRKIPDYFLLYDIRRPAHQYVDDKLTEIIQEIFEVRQRVEKNLSRNELLAYDKVLINYLEKDLLFGKLKSTIDNDFNVLNQVSQMQQMQDEDQENEKKQALKQENNQADFNREVKNEDAYFKLFAYSGMLEKQRRQDVQKTGKDLVIAMGIETFPEYYKQQLKLDAIKQPRPIDTERFKPIKNYEPSKVGEGFQTIDEKEADYFREFELFNENKKEQQERNMTYFILEQFFKKAKENPDPLDKAQQSIVEYFSNPDNTFFFDKNKIQ